MVTSPVPPVDDPVAAAHARYLRRCAEYSDMQRRSFFTPSLFLHRLDADGEVIARPADAHYTSGLYWVVIYCTLPSFDPYCDDLGRAVAHRLPHVVIETRNSRFNSSSLPRAGFPAPFLAVIERPGSIAAAPLASIGLVLECFAQVLTQGDR